MTSETDRKILLRLARAVLTAHVNGASMPAPGASVAITRRAGAFVTLADRGELRGCIGHVEGDLLLGDVIAKCAVAAATADPRFPPVTPAELTVIDIELSILGPLEAISSPVDIEIGRHGLVVERGGLRGLLLPQVATHWNLDTARFVAETCRKAGLPRDAHRNGAALWRFEAEVFGERS